MEDEDVDTHLGVIPPKLRAYTHEIIKKISEGKRVSMERDRGLKVWLLMKVQNH